MLKLPQSAKLWFAAAGVLGALWIAVLLGPPGMVGAFIRYAVEFSYQGVEGPDLGVLCVEYWLGLLCILGVAATSCLVAGIWLRREARRTARR